MCAPASIPSAWRNRIVGHADVDPATLIPNPDNWRSHPARQQRALRGALDGVGWVAQVLVNRRTGHLIDGHLRVEVALDRKEPTVPVTYVDLAEEEERLVLATFDPLGAMAGADADRLEELLAGLTPDDEALTALLGELATEHLRPRPGNIDPDALPEPPDGDASRVRVGQLWRLGDHRLLVGDATDPEAVARLLDGARPRLLVTDPPYGVEFDPTWRDGVYNDLAPGTPGYLRPEGGRNTSISGDTVVDWSAAFAHVPSIEVAYVWHAGVHAAAVAMGLERIGLLIRSQIIWAKTAFAMSRGDYHWQHEPCWYAVRDGATAGWLGAHDLSTLWELPSPRMIMGGSDEARFDHPTQKPLESMERPIRHHAGDVYEPFAGSGTTIIAAERERRRCYALEIEPRFATITIERWEAYTGVTAEAIDD